MAVTLTYSRLRTLDQEGNILNQVQQEGAAVLTGGVNYITERKSLYMEFSVAGDAEPQLVLPGSSIYVNFALWMPIGYAYSSTSGPPTTGFNFLIPEEMAERAEMFFYSNGSFEPDTCKNYKCYFKILTSTTYSIELEFYNTYDEGGYLNGVSKNNEYRFLSEFWNELNFDDISHSVYQMSKEIRIQTYIKNNSEATDADYSEKFETSIYQGQSQHFDQTIEVNQPAGDDLEFFSSVIDTDVEVTISSPADTFSKWYGKLIRIRNNTDLNFIENYELREFEIDGYGVSYNSDTDLYTLSFTIDKDWIENGATYRLMVTGYGGEPEAYNSVTGGVSGEINANGVVPYCDTNCEGSNLVFTGKLYDIDNEYTGNELTVSIEERIRTKLTVDYSADKFYNNLICRGWGSGESAVAATNDIRKYLTYVYLEFYTEYSDTNLGGTVKNRLELLTMQRTGVNTYTGGGITFSINPTTSIMTLEYDFRVRNQSGVPAIATYLNGSPYYPIQDNQYWGGGCFNHKLVYIKWRLQFYYHDFPTPFIDNIDFVQKLHCKDYDGHLTMRDVQSQGDDFVRGQVCVDDESNCFIVDIDNTSPCEPQGDPSTFKLINLIENVPISGNISEADEATPDIMTKLTHPAIVDQQANFTGGDASFCIDGTQLLEGQRYKITAMAKKIK